MKKIRTTYPWQKVYKTAILETDDSRKSGRIYEAVTAIEQRLRSPISREEEQALRDAQSAVSRLEDKSDQFR
jgi:hypothetical protein